jgi:hypothetical protein
MLRLETEAVTVKPDGRGAPVPRLVHGGQRSRAGATTIKSSLGRKPGR